MTQEYERRLSQALKRINLIKQERTLLKGHFSKIAKEYHVKVKDLKESYANAGQK